MLKTVAHQECERTIRRMLRTKKHLEPSDLLFLGHMMQELEKRYHTKIVVRGKRLVSVIVDESK